MCEISICSITYTYTKHKQQLIRTRVPTRSFAGQDDVDVPEHLQERILRQLAGFGFSTSNAARCHIAFDRVAAFDLHINT
jgi:hypothetical protein